MRHRKALIVDDSRLAQFVLKKMLIQEDIQVDTTESAEEALTYLETRHPDMIFLDHTMPGMNGLEVLKVIKANPEIAGIPVMMYTSQEDSSYMHQAVELGAVDVLPKQLKQSELQRALSCITPEEDKQEIIAQAANGPVLQATQPQSTKQSAKEDSEELKQLVMNAEAALAQETTEQKLRQQIERQRENFEQDIAELNAKIDLLVPAAENASSKQTFWNNLFWGAIYITTVAIFATVYFQQKSDINRIATLKQAAPLPTAVSRPPAQQTRSTPVQAVTTPPPQPVATPPRPQYSQRDIDALEEQFNSNNQIPYGELLLGDTVQTNLSELIPSLQQINFTGEVNVLAHDGSFCVNITDSGEFELAADDAIINQCQITDPSARLADIASIDVLQLITASNQSPESDFVITLNPVSVSRPIANYPPSSDSTTAGQWNTAALKNRRVEIQLVSN